MNFDSIAHQRNGALQEPKRQKLEDLAEDVVTQVLEAEVLGVSVESCRADHDPF